MTSLFDDDLEDLVNISNGEIATAPVTNDLLKSMRLVRKSLKNLSHKRSKLTNWIYLHRYRRQI